MVVNFNGKIDAVYINLNEKFDSLSTHLKKLETQVTQNSKAMKRHEALAKERSETGQRRHVSAIIDDDIWQVVKLEKLQEGDFKVESSMSFGSSHWCRSTPSAE